MVVIAVLCMGVAQAQVTTLVGKNYLELDVEAFDCLDLTGGFVGAVDYFTPQSQPLKNYQVDIGANYLGGYLKLDVKALSVGPATPYVAYKVLMRNSTPSDLYHVLEAGIGVELTDHVTVGPVYQYCHQRGDEDILHGSWMLALKLEW